MLLPRGARIRSLLPIIIVVLAVPTLSGGTQGSIKNIPFLEVREIRATHVPDLRTFRPLSREDPNDRQHYKELQDAQTKDIECLKEDFTLLGWPWQRNHPTTWYVDAITDDGKLLYDISYRREQKEEHGIRRWYEVATVIFDTARRRKWILRYQHPTERLYTTDEEQAPGNRSGLRKVHLTFSYPGNIDHTDISQNGKVLFLGLNDRTDNPMNKSDGMSYFISLEDPMTILFQRRGCTAGGKGKRRFSADDRKYFAGDGTVHLDERRFEHISWERWDPTEYTDVFVMSPDLRYIAAKYGVFPATEFVEGQWGMEVRTPSGHFILVAENRSLLPAKVEVDGTVIDKRGFVFRWVDGTYRCVSQPKGLPLGKLEVTHLP